MKRNSVQISELRLRASGLTKAEGRTLGHAVAKRLAELPATVQRSQTISRLSLHVKSGGHDSVDRIADEIVQVIKRQMN